jgi:2,4-dienoyl-CoA reductase-like NADH-dependent reductase (Old Yellow Enzyme family)
MHLFDPMKIRSVTLPNRIVVSPMCMYSSTDGFANDWHLVHLGSRAVGGAGMVSTEASAVLADGRISPDDLGIWKDEHIEALSRITKFIHGQGSIPGIQLAHAGRKASTVSPFKGAGSIAEENGGWKTIAPSAIPFGTLKTPTEIDLAGIREVVAAFAAAVRRAHRAGFQVVEVHAAHGYLIHEFLSPISNKRSDSYGGSFENRTRLLREVVAAIRTTWPEHLPLFVRISATDWVPEGGWDLAQSVELARQIAPLGVDVIDCSSGGTDPNPTIPLGPGYQVPFSEEIRRKTGIPTAAVGMITTAAQADAIVSEGKADLVLMAREFLRQPYWPLHAAQELNVKSPWAPQYLRAAPQGTPSR